MYIAIAYLRHLLTATNQHGVHSPFVYNYVTKCLYSKQQLSSVKSVNVLLKSILHFKIATLKLPKEREVLKATILQKFPEINLHEALYDMIYVDASSLKNDSMRCTDMNDFHPDAILLVDNIHRNRNNLANWKLLKDNDSVTVSIDLFYCGLIFSRTEQAKEHFKIRI